MPFDLTQGYSKCLNWDPNKQGKSFDVKPCHTIVFNVCHQKLDIPSVVFMSPIAPTSLS